MFVGFLRFLSPRFMTGKLSVASFVGFLMRRLDVIGEIPFLGLSEVAVVRSNVHWVTMNRSTDVNVIDDDILHF